MSQSPSAEERKAREILKSVGITYSEGEDALVDAIAHALCEKQGEIERLKDVIQLALGDMTEARCAGSGEDAYKNEMNEAAYKRLRDA